MIVFLIYLKLLKLIVSFFFYFLKMWLLGRENPHVARVLFLLDSPVLGGTGQGQKLGDRRRGLILVGGDGRPAGARVVRGGTPGVCGLGS